MKNLFLYLTSLLFIGLSAPTFADGAATITTTDVVSTLSNQVSAITAVGVAVLILAALVTGIAFVRRAGSGR